MAAYAQPVESNAAASHQLFNFLKAELAPHPGIYSTLARIVIATLITFLIAATFRMPYAAITLYSVFTIDRSSHRAAMIRAAESIVFISIGVGIALLGVELFVQFPLLTFIWYAGELFLAAFLIRTTRLPGPAMNMSMAMYSVHNIWERPYPAAPHLEQTLWVWLTLCLGFVISILVEFAFVQEKPLAQIEAGLDGRLRAVSSFFAAMAAQLSGAVRERQAVLSYASVGTASIRHIIFSLRNTDQSLRSQLLAINTVTALTARLIDVSATIDSAVRLSDEDGQRLKALAGEIDRIRAAYHAHGTIHASGYQPSFGPSDCIPALPELERAVVHIPTAFSASHPQDNDPGMQALEPQEPLSIFLPDAFANPGYLLFAFKTMLASVFCYITYSALDWPGLSTSVVTCLVTALNTTGATKQKQLLRLTGAAFGGLLALVSLVFLLPEIDSITGVTILIAAVSTLSAWFALASPRLSYFGLQTALAFYLALIQDYSATTQLAPARDRALGVLLGLGMMWLIFDALWPVSAVGHMQAGLARNLRLLAQLITALDQPDRLAAIQTIRRLRDRIQGGFAAVHGHADSVLFEFGSPDRRRNLMLRDAALRMQAALRTLFVVQIAISHYRTQVVPENIPLGVKQAQQAFDQALSAWLVQVADAVVELRHAASESQLNEAFEQYENALVPWARRVTSDWVKTRLSGILALSGQAVNLAGGLSTISFT